MSAQPAGTHPPSVAITVRCDRCRHTETVGRINAVTPCGQCGGCMVIVMAARVEDA